MPAPPLPSGPSRSADPSLFPFSSAFHSISLIHPSVDISRRSPDVVSPTHNQWLRRGRPSSVHAPVHTLGHRVVFFQLTNPTLPKRLARHPLLRFIRLLGQNQNSPRRDPLLRPQHMLVLSYIRQRSHHALGALPTAARAPLRLGFATGGRDVRCGGSGI